MTGYLANAGRISVEGDLVGVLEAVYQAGTNSKRRFSVLRTNPGTFVTVLTGRKRQTGTPPRRNGLRPFSRGAV